jgi:hypothetical protein
MPCKHRWSYCAWYTELFQGIWERCSGEISVVCTIGTIPGLIVNNGHREKHRESTKLQILRFYEKFINTWCFLYRISPLFSSAALSVAIITPILCEVAFIRLRQIFDRTGTMYLDTMEGTWNTQLIHWGVFEMFEVCKNVQCDIFYKGSVSEMKSSNWRHVRVPRRSNSLQMFDRCTTMNRSAEVQAHLAGGLFLFVAI